MIQRLCLGSFILYIEVTVGLGFDVVSVILHTIMTFVSETDNLATCAHLLVRLCRKGEVSDFRTAQHLYALCVGGEPSLVLHVSVEFTS